MSTSAINNLSSMATAAPATTTKSANPGLGSLANENVFLQLLVAQLKCQDPTQPADGTQFVTQLAEFTNVSNTAQMTSDLDSINKAISTLSNELTPPPATGNPPTTNGNTPPTTTNGNTSN